MIYQRYEKDMWNITWELFLEIGIMKLGYKCLGRIWRVPSLFRNFLGIFLCMEMGFVASYVHCPGVHSNFPRVQWLTRGASAVGSAASNVMCTGHSTMLWTHPLFLSVYVDRVHRRKGKREERVMLAATWGHGVTCR